MEIINQNLGAYLSGGNCAGDHDLSRYDKANNEGVHCGGESPSHRFRERAAMSFLALKVAHGNLRQNSIAIPLVLLRHGFQPPQDGGRTTPPRRGE